MVLIFIISGLIPNLLGLCSKYILFLLRLSYQILNSVLRSYENYLCNNDNGNIFNNSYPKISKIYVIIRYSNYLDKEFPIQEQLIGPVITTGALTSPTYAPTLFQYTRRLVINTQSTLVFITNCIQRSMFFIKVVLPSLFFCLKFLFINRFRSV